MQYTAIAFNNIGDMNNGYIYITTTHKQNLYINEVLLRLKIEVLTTHFYSQIVTSETRKCIMKILTR